MGDEGKPPASLAAREAGRRRRGQPPNSRPLDGQQGPRPTRTCRRVGHRPHRCRRASSDATSGEHLPYCVLWVQILSLPFSSHVTPDKLPSTVRIEAKPRNNDRKKQRARTQGAFALISHSDSWGASHFTSPSLVFLICKMGR